MQVRNLLIADKPALPAERENIREEFALKVRIKFSKTGNMRFIGHLDIMRYFQKAMRRAKIPIKYSEGFSPHQIMSFASPLSMAVEGYGEYMDIELREGESISSEEAVKALNENMCEGMKVLSFLKLADYMMVLKSDDEALVNSFYERLSGYIEELLKKESIFVEKKSKDSIKEVDIKGLINTLNCEIEKGKLCIFMNVGAGSSNNLKPELVLKALKNMGAEDITETGFKLKRLDLYAKGHKRLDEYGEEIM